MDPVSNDVLPHCHIVPNSFNNYGHIWNIDSCQSHQIWLDRSIWSWSRDQLNWPLSIRLRLHIEMASLPKYQKGPFRPFWGYSGVCELTYRRTDNSEITHICVFSLKWGHKVQCSYLIEFNDIRPREDLRNSKSSLQQVIQGICLVHLQSIEE